MPNGKAVEVALLDINGMIINNDGPTRVAERVGDSDSCTHLIIVYYNVLLDLKWKLLRSTTLDG